MEGCPDNRFIRADTPPASIMISRVNAAKVIYIVSYQHTLINYKPFAESVSIVSAAYSRMEKVDVDDRKWMSGGMAPAATSIS